MLKKHGITPKIGLVFLKDMTVVILKTCSTWYTLDKSFGRKGLVRKTLLAEKRFLLSLYCFLDVSGNFGPPVECEGMGQVKGLGSSLD